MPPLTNRERFHRMLDFAPVDRGFNFELPLWGQTYDRWWQEGMPRDVHIGNLMAGCEFFHVDRIGYLPLNVLGMFPPFEEEVLEEDERYLVKRFADGHVSRALKDGAAYGCIIVQGHGTFGAYEAEAAIMLRYGQLAADEYFVSEDAAKQGVSITNRSRWEPMVMLKHFGPNHPEMPRSAPVS